MIIAVVTVILLFFVASRQLNEWMVLKGIFQLNVKPMTVLFIGKSCSFQRWELCPMSKYKT